MYIININNNNNTIVVYDQRLSKNWFTDRRQWLSDNNGQHRDELSQRILNKTQFKIN
jgi:hypothetical protein